MKEEQVNWSISLLGYIRVAYFIIINNPFSCLNSVYLSMLLSGLSLYQLNNFHLLPVPSLPLCPRCPNLSVRQGKWQGKGKPCLIVYSLCTLLFYIH
jgi:hypothetical protein